MRQNTQLFDGKCIFVDPFGRKVGRKSKQTRMQAFSSIPTAPWLGSAQHNITVALKKS